MSRHSKKPAATPPPQQEGMPHPDSVVEVKEFVSPKGRRYRILKTTEIDATDATDAAGKPRKKPEK